MEIITKREQEILSIIEQEPLISQKELAQRLGLTRSSVAVHIANLMKKGYIKGKGYILNSADYITVIGGSNIDIAGFSNAKLRKMDSNPGRIKISLGGVGRNIAENIVKLGIETALITAIGDDLYGEKILNDSRLAGINMDNALVLKNMSSSTYLSIMDCTGDMNIAVSDMESIDQLDIEYIRKKEGLIRNSNCVVLDTNLRKDVIEFLLNNYSEKNFLVDTVSVAKAAKISGVLNLIHTLKPNKLEAEQLTGVKIATEGDVKRAITVLLYKGVKAVVISLSDKGVYYGDKSGIGKIAVPKVKVVNSTGAGDSFMAGLVYGYINEKGLFESCKIAMAASILALQHENTINPNFSIECVLKTMEGLI